MSCCKACCCGSIVVPSPCWILAHVLEKKCQCCCKPCEACNKVMARLTVQGFDVCNEEDVMFVARVAREEGGNGDKTVKVFAKWKSGDKTGWRFKN